MYHLGGRLGLDNQVCPSYAVWPRASCLMLLSPYRHPPAPGIISVPCPNLFRCISPLWTPVPSFCKFWTCWQGPVAFFRGLPLPFGASCFTLTHRSPGEFLCCPAGTPSLAFTQQQAEPHFQCESSAALPSGWTRAEIVICLPVLPSAP